MLHVITITIVNSLGLVNDYVCSCKAPESKTIDSGAIQIIGIIICNQGAGACITTMFEPPWP